MTSQVFYHTTIKNLSKKKTLMQKEQNVYSIKI